jgi:hypothetical protein
MSANEAAMKEPKAARPSQPDRRRRYVRPSLVAGPVLAGVTAAKISTSNDSLAG